MHPLPFLALLSHRGWERPYIGAGLVLYDTMGTALGRSRGVPAQKHFTRGQTLKKFPALKKDAFTGAIQYYDAQVDDARHTMFVARTAAAFGAQVATRTQAVGFLREGEHVTGVKVVDLESDRTARRRSSCARARRSTRPACGPTTRRTWSARAGSSTCGRPRACTCWCRATASTATPR